MKLERKRWRHMTVRIGNFCGRNGYVVIIWRWRLILLNLNILSKFKNKIQPVFGFKYGELNYIVSK